MSVPTYDRFIEPILRFLATRPDGVPAREAHEAAADSLLLTASDRELSLPTGQATYKNRAGWAHDRLKRAGFSASPKHGIWCLTEAGRKFVADNPASLLQAQVDGLARNYLDVKLRPGGPGATTGSAADDVQADEVQSPDDRLLTALGEIRTSVSSEILDLLLQVSPKYFETVVLDLLHKLGYGTSRSDLQRVGGSGDGGIDGVISLDRLGLEKVYVQAKRWQGAVGRPEIQGFYGALAGQRANKGVFLTTSAFTAQAVEFARSVERIVLVDGVTLASLMMDHQVGVSSQNIRIPKIDSDYFDE